jgi:hypothetical protein
MYITIHNNILYIFFVNIKYSLLYIKEDER